MEPLGIEEQVRLLALPLFDDAAVPTLNTEKIVAITRGHLQRTKQSVSDEVIQTLWEEARAAVRPSRTAINATVLELVLNYLEDIDASGEIVR